MRASFLFRYRPEIRQKSYRVLFIFRERRGLATIEFKRPAVIAIRILAGIHVIDGADGLILLADNLLYFGKARRGILAPRPPKRPPDQRQWPLLALTRKIVGVMDHPVAHNRKIVKSQRPHALVVRIMQKQRSEEHTSQLQSQFHLF